MAESSTESTHFHHHHPESVTDSVPGRHADVAMRGRVCHPSIKHPIFSSTLYPSTPPKRDKSILACLKALDPI
ncbi:hypothetical protein Sjap_024759 [Stephania japonica]|uniref:Uncharacterized protein n=1 Tax=Stephania japonica TaxID=461633 RepID=A0AAP0EH73_9MAGN